MTRGDRDCILRYATGTSLCLGLALAIGWPLSNLAPVLAAAFLGNRNPAPGWGGSLRVLLAIVIIFGTALLASTALYNYPAVFLVLFCYALFLNFYAAARGASAFAFLLYTMAILLLPLLGGPQPAVANTVALGFLVSAGVALLVSSLVHLLFPGGTRAPVKTEAETGPAAAAESAWLSCAVILPFALTCLVFNLTGAVLPLIMIAMLSQKPDFSAGAAGGKALLAANLGGGLVAVLFYQALLISPTLPFIIAGCFAIALLFGSRLFSDRPLAPLYGSAFSTVLILIGSSTGTFSDSASSEFYQRVLLIFFAVFYVIGALSLLQSLHLREKWMATGRWIGARLQRKSAA